MQADQSESVPFALQVRICIPQLPHARVCGSQGVMHVPHAHAASQVCRPRLPSPHMRVSFG